MAALSTSNRTITITKFSFKFVLFFVLLSFLTFTTEAAHVTPPLFLNESCSSNETFSANSVFQSNLKTLPSSLLSNTTDSRFYNTTEPPDVPPPPFLNEICSSNETFSANSVFQSNRRTLLSSLAFKAPGNSGFYNTIVDAGTHSDKVYGLFMCRGDVPLDLCRECVLNATQRLGGQGSDSCRFSKVAIIWYDECMVRYSYRNFFSTVDANPKFFLWNSGTVKDSMILTGLLKTIVNEVAEKTATGVEKYATEQKNHTLYALAQCTPDLSPDVCRSCLRSVIGDISLCCLYTMGGRVLYPSCNIRYELYPFFNRTASLAPTPTAKQKGKF